MVGLEDDARVVRPVRGQVAVATTPGQVRRIRLIPDNPPATPDAVEAIMSADMVTLGPGSWFTSVLPHLQVPELVGALRDTSAQRVVVLNLSSEPGETAGFSSERHVHMLTQHAPDLTLDKILVDESTIGGASERSYLERAAATLSAEVVYADVREIDAEGGWTERHDPVKVAAALGELLSR